MEHADGRVTPPPFPVLLWLWNSVKVATITAIGIVTLSTTCAYAFARMRFPGKATLLKGMLIFQMFRPYCRWWRYMPCLTVWASTCRSSA